VHKPAGDGYLDAQELPPALYGLLNYDANGDGRISAAEYLGALRQVQLEMSLDQQYVSLPLHHLASAVLGFGRKLTCWRAQVHWNAYPRNPKHELDQVCAVASWWACILRD
jgi:hypothetical protein